MVKNIKNKLIGTTLVILSIRNIVLTAKAKFECGYKQCPQTREGALNVHLIPHSHMDAGWVKTFDEYYFGTRSTVSTANVQLIYHSVVTELLHDKRRKFTFSETAFFWRWWKEQRPQTRATFRNLVQEGRIEFAGGGWVQNDEATPDYLQIIDQFTWGLRKLNDTLGPCGKPKAAWQIDTYGHTKEQASLLAQMGYDGLFIGRVDHKAREAMIDEDRMEFMWRGSDTLGKMSDIMTHTLYNLYNAPSGFCFDFLCNDEPIVDDPDDRVYNADRRVIDFISHLERQAKYYDHDNINVMMGGDFTYQSAANWFMNMDKLINHVTTHPANLSDINIFYSTPSCYLKAIYLYGRRDKALYTEKADHLPYGSDVYTYWTGYYTSRPSLKYLARMAHKFLQVMKQVTVLARSGDSYELHLLRHAVALVLHHDGITGTSQQHVTNDFIRLISEAIDVSVKKTSNLLSNLTPTWGGSRRSKNNQLFTVCLQLNMSQCEFMERQESMILLVYNPMSVKTYYYVRLPAIALHYSIRDSNDEEVEYQLLPLPTAVTSLPGRSSQAIQELVFEAENIPPLGFTAYYIASIRDQLEENEYAKKSHAKHADDSELVPYISNEYIKVSVNKETGLLESIQHMDGLRIDMSQNFYFYGQNETGVHSGAYSFRPEKNRPTPVTERVLYHTVRGPLVKEIRQRFSEWASQVIRLYRGEEFVELEWVIGPVPVTSDLGKEVVTVFSTNITNNGEFLVDANSKQIMKRSCWNVSSNHQQKKPVAACYSPVTSRICIRSLNNSVEMCVLPDRTQGGTSYNEGEIELMVHRRLLTDDDFGLEETLNEEAYGAGLIVKGRHRIVVGNYKQDLEGLTFSERASQAARRYNNEPWLFFTSGERINRRKWQNVRNKRYSAVRVHGLPRHVQVLTLEPWKAGSVLLRLENTLEKPVRARTARDKSEGQGDVLRSSYLTVDLRKVFVYHQVRAVRETTLAANQWMDDARQMDWSTRYVYNGGDDGILPEDNIDYKDDPKTSPNDSAPDSQEDTGYRRKKQSKPSERSKQNTKSSKQFNYDNRKKRSLNKTVSIDENIVNETLDNETRTDSPPKKTRNKYNNEDVNETNEAPKLVVDRAAPKAINNKFSTVTRVEIDHRIKKGAARYSTVTRKTPKSILNGRMKSTRYGDSNKNSDEVASDEDFSYNSRKRARRRNSRRNTKSTKHIDVHKDATDDGVTKSIYEMYYKNLKRHQIAVTAPVITKGYREGKIQRRNSDRFRRIIDKNSQEDDSTSYETSARENKYRSRVRDTEISERGRKIYRYRAEESGDSEERGRVSLRGRNRVRSCGEDRDMAPKSELSQLRDKRRREDPEDEYEMRFVASDESQGDEDTTTHGRRSKRMIAKQEELQGEAGSPEPSEPRDQDFVVTLRPTQIRTFVVWFDEKKITN